VLFVIRLCLFAMRCSAILSCNDCCCVLLWFVGRMGRVVCPAAFWAVGCRVVVICCFVVCKSVCVFVMLLYFLDKGVCVCVSCLVLGGHGRLVLTFSYAVCDPGDCSLGSSGC